KDLLLEGATLVDGVDVAVLAVGVDDPVAVDRRGVDAPLEAVGVVRLNDGGALELPFDGQAGAQLCDEEGSRRWRPCAWAAVGVVVVVLDHDGIGPAVREDGRGAVPAEVEGGQELSRRAELPQVAASEVVARVRPIEDRAVRCYGRRGRRLGDHATGGGRVGGRGDGRGGA